MPMKRASFGFSVIELMIVLLIASIVLAMGAPSFIEFRKNNRLTGTANDFLGALQTARTEAIKRQTFVSVCPSANPAAAAPVCGGGIYTGWIAFADPDQNCQRTGAELNAANLIRVGGPVEAAVNVRSNGNCVTFAGTGFTVTATGALPMGRTMFCDDRGEALQNGTNLSNAREVEVNNVGRARTSRVVADFALPEFGAAVGACP